MGNTPSNEGDGRNGSERSVPKRRPNPPAVRAQRINPKTGKVCKPNKAKSEALLKFWSSPEGIAKRAELSKIRKSENRKGNPKFATAPASRTVLDLPRFGGEVRAWNQGIWSDGGFDIGEEDAVAVRDIIADDLGLPNESEEQFRTRQRAWEAIDALVEFMRARAFVADGRNLETPNTAKQAWADAEQKAQWFATDEAANYLRTRCQAGLKPRAVAQACFPTDTQLRLDIGRDTLSGIPPSIRAAAQLHRFARHSAPLLTR